MEDYCRFLLEDFLKSSFQTVKMLVEGAMAVKGQAAHRKVTLFRYDRGKKVSVPFDDERFYLRSSVEYTNPHLTVEEVQGIVGTRLLETCANYYYERGLHDPTADDVSALMELLKKPTEGYIVPFLLNTDDVEADRYSMNPLKQSIVDSGQSAFPAVNVKTDQLKIDHEYVKKYDGSLISKKETALIEAMLMESNGSYLDFVDAIKYMQLQDLTDFCGMDLSLFSLRLPLSTLQTERKDGLLHYIISESNRDYASVEEAYICMGRSMNKRTTLLTVPHSKKGFGSKRAARGKLHFENSKFLDATVTYKTTALYPNAMDPEDVAVAVCDDKFSVKGERLSDYSYNETPSSPQFFLYSLGSPEDATVWHGVGAFGSSQLLQSYANARTACREGRLLKDLNRKYHLNVRVPLQFNLAPEGLWSHPIHRNIDASIGSVENLADLAHRGMKLEYLSAFK
ncbi:MAG: hypothetical protein M1540_02080 [Candidatus Bathyarchaeota archaeon]|nr:hypothetical protein [Candidatus Bathyarchaeota archaeon]